MELDTGGGQYKNLRLNLAQDLSPFLKQAHTKLMSKVKALLNFREC